MLGSYLLGSFCRDLFVRIIAFVEILSTWICIGTAIFCLLLPLALCIVDSRSQDALLIIDYVSPYIASWHTQLSLS